MISLSSQRILLPLLVSRTLGHSLTSPAADKGYHPTERMILMPMGTLNIKKWHELLDRSIEKYKDYVITVDHFK